MDAIKKKILSNGIAYASLAVSLSFWIALALSNLPAPILLRLPGWGWLVNAARLALGALRSVRLVLRNRRDRTPAEIVAGASFHWDFSPSCSQGTSWVPKLRT
jgi:hypothetical protein